MPADAFIPPHVRGLDVYQPGKPIEELERELGISGAIKVASNENPLGPSPKAVAALPAALGQLHLYPDAGGFALRRALAGKYKLELGQIALGNGSNDLLYQLVVATCEPTDEVLTHEYAFLSYRLAAQVMGRPFVAVTTKDLACDVDALIAGITPRTKLVVLGSPNNPTGSVISRAGMDRVLAALPARALLVIDEAYAEYAARWPEVDHVDGLVLRARDPRVITLRTFSKIYGLAGLRVGFAAADQAVVDVLGKVGRTFHVSSLAQVAAIAALDDDAHVERSAQLARSAIERLQREVTGPGVRVYPSLANFALIECGRPSGPIYDQLLRKGVIVRPMAAWGLPTCIRVSVAKDSEMPRVIATLNEVLRDDVKGGLKSLICVVAVVVACGAHPKRKPGGIDATAIVRPATATDRLIALLPTGPQLVVEVDLARLRANPVVGPMIVKLLGPTGIERLAGFADAEQVVFAAYGLGTTQAATVTLMTAKADLQGTTKIADKIYAVGPADWVAQVSSRAAIDATTPLNADKALLELRDRAMPPNAPGASIRVAAHLTFDARIALARITGIENAPGELSAWADVADDFAIIVDADSRDGDAKKPAEARKDLARMKSIMMSAIGQLAREPSVIALGLPGSLTDAKVATRGTWVRSIVAIGPRHLQRVVERARTLLGEPAPPSEPAPSTEPAK